MTKSTPRVNLDEQAHQALQEMLAELHQSHEFAKIKPAELASWVFVWFYKNAFARKKEEIAKEYFNSKKYFKKIMNSVNEKENLEQILRQALNQIKQPPKKRPYGRSKPKQIGQDQ